MKSSKNTASEIELIDTIVFKPCNLELTNIITEQESQAYFAHRFHLNGHKVIYRKAKITPTKTGQFVTIWKRNEKGITQPFDIIDEIDFFIIIARKDEAFGVFIFPKNILYENAIISSGKKVGKRGIRVYPPWEVPNNKQALKTQIWQSKYFLNLTETNELNLVKAVAFLNLKDWTRNNF